MAVDRVFCCGTDSWASSDALLFIYFSDNELLKSSSSVLKQSRDFLDCQLTGRRFSGVLMDRNLDAALVSIAIKLKVIEPRLKSITKAPKLLWIRFAFQNMMKLIQPAQTYLDWYAIWRYSVASGPEMGGACRLIVSQRDRIKAVSNRNTFDYELKRYPCYPIDYFLLNQSVPATLDSEADWVLLPDGRVEEQATTKKKRVKRIVGANAYEVIAECVEEAATKRKITGLRKEKIGDRYISSKSRLELAEALRRRFGTRIKYAESTIVRALSQFVACPKHRKPQGKTSVVPIARKRPT